MSLHNATSGHIKDLKRITLITYCRSFDIPFPRYLNPAYRVSVWSISGNDDSNCLIRMIDCGWVGDNTNQCSGERICNFIKLANVHVEDEQVQLIIIHVTSS